ncbi:hypothetical protein C8R46DRAFT_434454 [Mycena filopes]|nr:hypothetical protein C8R46DRAFT_434454 [Mycena filopes]
MAETQVVRAKKLKVHFYGCEAFNAELQIKMFRFLAQHAAQWEELGLGITSHIAPLLSMLRDRVPLLRRFFLWWESRNGLTIDRVDCFQNAPSLVGAWVSDFPPIPVLFPAHHLTRYQLYSSWDDHADILKQTPNLVEARITVDLSDSNWPDGHEIIDLTCLRRLFVSHAEILKLLRFPGLEEITIEISEAAEGLDILAALRSATSRSLCPLRRLCFWGLPFPSSVADILGQFPSIVDFAAILSGSDDSRLVETLMKHLTITANVVARQSRHISFACEDDAAIDYHIYEEMITSRWKAGGFVASQLLVASGPLPDNFVLGRMAKLCEEGFDFIHLQGLDADDAITLWTLEPQCK